MKKLYKNNVRLNDYQGVNRLLARTINGVIQDEITEEKAKVISTLCNTLLKSLDADLEKDLKIEEQKARIENIKARTQSLSELGQDIEDIRYLHEMFGTMPKLKEAINEKRSTKEIRNA